jgi:hypothetical protein
MPEYRAASARERRQVPNTYYRMAPLASASDKTIRFCDVKIDTEITHLEADAAVFCLLHFLITRLAVGDQLNLHWVEVLG